MVSLFAIATLLLACTQAEPAPPPVTTPLPENGEPGTYRLSFDHDGLRRSAVVYVPDAAPSAGAAPLMMNFHGFGGTAEDHLLWADMRDLADRDGILLVYPQGSLLDGSPHWNAALDGPDNKSDADDLGFAQALVDNISASYAVDADRIYAAGYSNGGMFAFALACYQSGLVAGVASVSGTMLEGTETDCAARSPTAVITLHGTADDVLAYDGGEGALPAQDIVDFWVGHNQTDPTPATQTETDGGTTIEHFAYTGGTGGVAVAHYRYQGGGHVWFEDEFAGANASTLVWDFLTGFDVAGAL